MIQDVCERRIPRASQRVRRRELFPLEAGNNFGVEMINRGSSRSRIILYVLAPAVEEVTPMLDASKTVGFKAILCCKSCMNLGWVNFLLVKKLNDNSLLKALGK
jgi:hypothetical protein